MSLSIPRKVRADTFMRLDMRQLYKCGALRPEALTKSTWLGRTVYCYADKSDSRAVADSLWLVFDPQEFDAAARSVKMTQTFLSFYVTSTLAAGRPFGSAKAATNADGCSMGRWTIRFGARAVNR